MSGPGANGGPAIGALDPRNPMRRVYPGAFTFDAAAGALRFLLPLALAERGLGPAGIGFVVGVFALVSLVSRGAAAGLYRYRRAPRLILVAGALSTLGFLLLPLADGAPVASALMALDGFAWAIVTTSLLAIVITHTPPQLPSTAAMGWWVGLQGAALAVGAFAAGIAGQVLGVWEAVVVFAFVPVAAAALVSVSLPAPGTVLVEEHEARRAAATAATGDDELGVAMEDAPLRDAVAPSLATRGLARVRAVIDAARGLPAAVWSASIVAAYLNVMNGILQTFFPLLGVASGLSLAQIGTLSALRTAISSVARFGAGWIFDRVDPRRLHLPMLTTSALSVALLPLTASSFLLTTPLMAFSGISRGLLRVTTSAAAMDALAGRRAAPAAAVMTAGLDVGKIVGPLVGGMVAAIIGLEAMFFVVPLAFLGAALVAAAIGRRQRRSSDPATGGA